MEKQEWAVVKSGAGNIHLMPYENRWASDEVIHAFPGEMTKKEAEEAYREYLEEEPKVKAYKKIMWDISVSQFNKK